jgi:hypothetical protein
MERGSLRDRSGVPPRSVGLGGTLALPRQSDRSGIPPRSVGLGGTLALPRGSDRSGVPPRSVGLGGTLALPRGSDRSGVPPRSVGLGGTLALPRRSDRSGVLPRSVEVGGTLCISRGMDQESCRPWSVEVGFASPEVGGTTARARPSALDAAAEPGPPARSRRVPGRPRAWHACHGIARDARSNGRGARRCYLGVSGGDGTAGTPGQGGGGGGGNATLGLDQALDLALRHPIVAATQRYHRLQARGPGGEASLRVSDRGAGIDDETLEKAVLPFYSTKKSGSGGLALCREIATVHGGTLALRRREGGGVEVECRLPEEPAGSRRRAHSHASQAMSDRRSTAG